jgi:hypothetical protein
MSIEKSFVLLICAISVIFLYTGCNQNKTDNINRKVLQETKEKATKSRPEGRENRFTTEEQRTVVDACSEAFNLCGGKCKNISCYDRCKEELSACQADY